MASTGHSGSQSVQSMHSSGSITSMFGPSWKQSTGHTSTQSVSLHLMQASVTTKVMNGFRVGAASETAHFTPFGAALGSRVPSGETETLQSGVEARRSLCRRCRPSGPRHDAGGRRFTDRPHWRAQRGHPMNPVTLARHEDIAVITVDNPPVNALSRAVRAGLMEAFEAAEGEEAVRALVLACAGRTFIAGADIREFDRPPEEPHLPDLVERIEACGKPVLAAIHGTALGGGLEVAMGCHYRLAAPDAKLGLPEVKLGLLPGATGTQRLPRLVGVGRALEMMLSGDPIDAGSALQAGLIDRVTSGEDLLAEALAWASELVEPRRVRELPVPPVEREVFEKARQKLATTARGLFSPAKIVRAVELATELDYDAGVLAERELFKECKASPQSSGLRHAFFAEREAAKVPGLAKDAPVREIRRVAVLGAGTMGTGIAYACLSAGLPVRLLDNDDAGLARGEDAIRGLFEAGIARGKLEAADMVEGLRRLKITQDYEQVADADLVIEAVYETLAIKKEVFGKLDAVCRKGAILATNTSTLDVDAIAGATQRPEDVIGLHFFS